MFSVASFQSRSDHMSLQVLCKPMNHVGFRPPTTLVLSFNNCTLILDLIGSPNILRFFLSSLFQPLSQPDPPMLHACTLTLCTSSGNEMQSTLSRTSTHTNAHTHTHAHAHTQVTPSLTAMKPCLQACVPSRAPCKEACTC